MVFCHKCGKKMMDGSIYCDKCGIKLCNETPSKSRDTSEYRCICGNPTGDRCDYCAKKAKGVKDDIYRDYWG